MNAVLFILTATFVIVLIGVLLIKVLSKKDIEEPVELEPITPELKKDKTPSPSRLKREQYMAQETMNKDPYIRNPYGFILKPLALSRPAREKRLRNFLFNCFKHHGSISDGEIDELVELLIMKKVIKIDTNGKVTYLNLRKPKKSKRKTDVVSPSDKRSGK